MNGNEEELWPDSAKRCIRSAMNILSYADNSPRRLYQKLRQKGYSADEAEIALCYCREKGYLNEERQIESAVHQMATGKLYGKRRMMAELSRLGFSREAIGGVNFSEIDFDENCYQLWLKRGGITDDRTKRYLLSHGYSGSEINRAQKRIKENQDEESGDEE